MPTRALKFTINYVKFSKIELKKFKNKLKENAIQREIFK